MLTNDELRDLLRQKCKHRKGQREFAKKHNIPHLVQQTGIMGIMHLTTISYMIEHVRQADATTEIEITPAMKEAGALALSEYNKFVETSEDGAIAVFIAMTKAALHPIE